VIDAIKKVENTCKKIRYPLGYHVVPIDAKLVKDRINSGYSFIAFSTDFLFIGESARINVSKIKR